MKALEFTGTLHTIDQDGRPMLVAECVRGQVHVQVEPRTGSVSVSYPYPIGMHSGRTASLSLDVPRRIVSVLLTPTARLQGLRRQAMRKGRRGWRRIR